jgi:ribose transport system permease protein
MGFIKQSIRSTSFPAFVLFLILMIINIIITPGFLSTSYLNNFFAANAPLVCLALGGSVVIISGGIDLSVGAIICLCNVTMVTLFGKGFGIPETIAICILMSIGMGALNGLLIAVIRINPMMTTFATQSMFAGLALWVMSKPGGSSPKELTRWFATKVLDFIPMSLIVMLAVLVLILLMMRTPIGMKLYAIGNSEEKAYISGVRVAHIKFFIYTLSGFVAGVAAICYTGRTGGGDPTAAMTMTLSFIAACVIGGISLTGGKGSFVGSFWGALFLQMIISIILSMRVPTMAKDLVEGLIIFVGVAGTAIVFGREHRKKMNDRLSLSDRQGG